MRYAHGHSFMHACMCSTPRCSTACGRNTVNTYKPCMQHRRGIRTFMHARMHVLPLECVPVHCIHTKYASGPHMQPCSTEYVRLFTSTCMHVVYTCKSCSTCVFARCKRIKRAFCCARSACVHGCAHSACVHGCTRNLLCHATHSISHLPFSSSLPVNHTAVWWQVETFLHSFMNLLGQSPHMQPP